jgi:hypothetical protein
METAQPIGDGLTFEKVWAAIQATNAQMEETDRRMKETARQMEETDKQIKAFKEENAQGFKELREVHKETERALTEAQRIVGDLGNKFGDIAKQTLVPDLVSQFERIGFTFEGLSRNVEWKKKECQFSMELDALLENDREAMVVEVKSKLKIEDIDEQIRRMGEIRRYADLRGDKRQYYCAMAALTAPGRVISYALSEGFYLVMPSGEDVIVTKPTAGPRIW